MAIAKPSIEDLLATSTRAGLRAALAASRLAINLPQAQTLIAHLNTFEPAAQALRIGIVHSYTSELLDPWLELAAGMEGLALQIYHAPYGMTVQEAQPHSGLVAHAPDLTLLLLQREDLHPALTKPVGHLSLDQQDDLRREIVARLAAITRLFRTYEVGHLVVSLLPSLQSPVLGLFDATSEFSENSWWSRIKADFSTILRDSISASIFLDLDEVLLELGRAHFFDLRLWYSARFPFTPEASREIARRIVALGAVLKLPKAKVIVLDADNTLWGGIVGEDGLDRIALGPDYPGNTFVAFQRRILHFRQRGFILALCSKNNAADVDQVLREHPHQVLRDEHFAARRVNWLPKPDNLISLAQELNVGLESFIFVDDSDHECAAVRQQLLQVEVVQTPSRPLDIPICLDHVARLEVLSLTAEDLAKTAMYAEERQRRGLKERADKSVEGIADYLASLEMAMQISVDELAHLPRLSQLTQKTNQFNLTTRRYSEHQIQQYLVDDDWMVADFSLSDVFGSSGIVGLAIIRIADSHVAEIDTFLMSCRVIGRTAEAAFLHYLLRRLAEQGVDEVSAEYLPTAKNGLVKDFLPEHGFNLTSDGKYRRVLRDNAPHVESAYPVAITVAA